MKPAKHFNYRSLFLRGGEGLSAPRVTEIDFVSTRWLELVSSLPQNKVSYVKETRKLTIAVEENELAVEEFICQCSYVRQVLSVPS